MISVLIPALWTIVAFRLLAVRATVSARTLASYSMLGALLGIIGAPFIRAVAAPYGEQGPSVDEMTSLGMQALLLVPVIFYLFFRRTHAVTSVADSFLLAFALGFGFDLAGALLSASSATTPLKGLSYWPPFQIDLEKASVAGYGYWSGLVALGVAAALRFGRKFYIAVVAGIVILFWVVTEHAALLSPIQEKPDHWIAGFGNVTLHGTLTGWIAVVALVGFSIWEALWAGPNRGAGGRARFQALEHLQSLLNALGGGKRQEFLRLSTLFRCKRQSVLAHAELKRSPDDHGLAQMVRQLDQRIQELEGGPGEITASSTPAVPFWRSHRLAQVIILAALALIVWVPATVGTFFWSLPLLHFQFSGLPTILISALMLFIAWCFVAAAARPACLADADGVVQFHGEEAVLRISLLAVLLVFFFTPLDSLYPFPSLVAAFTGSRLPEFVPANKDGAAHTVQLATMLLLFAAAASAFSLSSAALWRRAPIGERRRAALRNGLTLAGASVAIWLCLGIYKDVLGWSHHLLGALFFKVQRWFSLKETFGISGNTLGAATAAFFTCLLCLGGVALHRVVLRRLENFFIDEPAAQPIPKAIGRGQGA